MVHTDPRFVTAVPKLHAQPRPPEITWRQALGPVIGSLAVALLAAGLAATAGWGAFIVWSLFSLVRWAVG